MNKNFLNSEVYQLEIPFTKSSYKNNLNNSIKSRILIEHQSSISKDEYEFWINPLIPSKHWDKRPMKKFIVELYINKYSTELIEFFATSRKVAKNFLENNYGFVEIYELDDFPTKELNEEIASEFNYCKQLNKEHSDNNE